MRSIVSQIAAKRKALELTAFLENCQLREGMSLYSLMSAVLFLTMTNARSQRLKPPTAIPISCKVTIFLRAHSTEGEQVTPIGTAGSVYQLKAPGANHEVKAKPKKIPNIKR